MALWRHNKDYVIFVMIRGGSCCDPGGCLTYFKLTGRGRVLGLLGHGYML